MDMAYFSPQKQSLFYSEHSVVQVSDVTLSNLNSMCNTFSVGTSAQQARIFAFDLNGGARIPFLCADGTPAQGLQGYTDPKKLAQDRKGWYDVSRVSLNFVSYIGTTIYTNDGNTYGVSDVNGLEGDYISNATYLNVTCRATDNYNASAFPTGVNARSLYSINSTEVMNWSNLSATDPPRSFDIWARVAANLGLLPEVAHASCHLHGVPIEMKVHCTAGQCAATRLRFKPGAAQINRTAFDNSNFTSAFFNHLLLSNGMPNDDTPDRFGAVSPIAKNFFSAFGGLIDMLTGIPLSDMNMTLAGAKAAADVSLSSYMTTLINTYYQASLDPTQGSANDGNQYNESIAGIINSTINSPDFLTGTIKGALYNPQYRLSIPWVIVDLISCKILLAAALAAMWLRKNTLAPDIFGYVSSLTRDNPHLNLPEGGSGMSGLERARALKKVKVRIADVADENGVGKVGLRYAGTGDDGGLPMAHLRRERHYV